MTKDGSNNAAAANAHAKLVKKKKRDKELEDDRLAVEIQAKVEAEIQAKAEADAKARAAAKAEKARIAKEKRDSEKAQAKEEAAAAAAAAQQGDVLKLNRAMNFVMGALYAAVGKPAQTDGGAAAAAAADDTTPNTVNSKKPPTNGFFTYKELMRPIITKICNDASDPDVKVNQTEVSKIASLMWKELTEDQKQAYKAVAKADWDVKQAKAAAK